MDNLKKAAVGASIFLTRAKQYTEEKLGGAERTEYDSNFDLSLRKADSTRGWTERIVSNTEAILQPNPNERIEDYLLTKLDKKPMKPNNLETLGHCLKESGQEIGSATQYGSTLVKVGDAEKRLGQAEHEFVQKVSDSFVQPLRSFLEGQMRIIQKEKKTLESKRLDLDACKTKLKKQKESRTKSEDILRTEDELRHAQTDFDRQLELTRLLLDELHVTHSHHLRCLQDFVEAQLTFHTNCTKVLQDLHKQIGGTRMDSNKIDHNAELVQNQPIVSISKTELIPNKINQQLRSAHITNNDTPKSTNKNRRVRVLFDYEASDDTELSVFANEILHVRMDADDNNWVYGEKDNKMGKIPKAYIQIE